MNLHLVCNREFFIGISGRPLSKLEISKKT